MPLLSGKAVDRLTAVPMTMFDRTIGEARRQAEAREAVEAAARELGIDPIAPPLPDFTSSESLIAAACRVLELPVEKPLAQHGARTAAARAAAERIAGLRERRAELEQTERRRLRDAILAGKTPGPAPADAIAEDSALAAELGLIGALEVEQFVTTSEPQILRDAASEPDALPTVVFYGQLVVEPLAANGNRDGATHRAIVTARKAAAELRSLLRPLEYQDGEETTELRATLVYIQRAIETANLHPAARQAEVPIEQQLAAARGAT